MSESSKETRVVHRGIPRLKANLKPSSTSTSRTDENKTQSQATTNTQGNGNKQHKHKNGSESAKSPPGLSLQGPFNPEIVASARKQDDKRKRPEPVTGKFLTSVRSLEDLASKRNPSVEKEKLKYQRHFSAKAETKFANGDTEEKRVLQFNAKGPVKTKGFRELKKSEEELQKKVVQLEVSLRDLELIKHSEVGKLDTELKQANEKVITLEQELHTLQDEFTTYKSTSSRQFKDQEDMFSKTNQSLQDRVNSCVSRLQQCNIDPVTLDSLDIDQQALEQKRLKAVEQAINLQKKLSQMNERNKEMMKNIKACMEETDQVLHSP